MTRRSNISFLLLIAVCAFLLFVPALYYPLIKKEEETLYEQVVHNSFLSQFHHYRHFSYHPIPRFSLKLDAFFWGNNLWGFRASNFLFHLLNGLLYFYLLRSFQLFPSFCAFLTLLFLLHPLQVENVLTLSGRSPLIGLFCFLSSLALLKISHKKECRPLSLQLLLFFIIQIFSSLSLESMVLAPLLIFFFSPRSKSFLIASGVANLLSASIHWGIAVQQKTLLAGWQGETVVSNILTRLPAIAEQTLEFMFPFQLCFYYSIPLQTSVHWIFVASLCWIVGLGVALKKSKIPLCAFWFGCLVLPYLFTFFPFPQKFVKQDAFAMFPLLGFTSLAGFILCKKTIPALGLRVGILACFFLISSNLIQSWKDPLSAWTRASYSRKGGSGAQYELGAYYLEEAQKQTQHSSETSQLFLKQAKQVFEKALQHPLEEETQFWCCLKLSILWLHEGNDAEALRYLKTAEALTQQETRAPFYEDKRYYVYQNQAQIYDRQGNSRVAQSYWRKLIQSYPQEIQPRFSLAISQNQFGSPQDALNTLVDILKIDPKYYLARLQMGKIHFNLKEYALAKQQFLRVLEYTMPPEDEKETLYNLALTYHSLQEYGEEEECLKKLIALAPELWLSQKDLAWLEKKKGKIDDAIRLLLLALQNLEKQQNAPLDSILPLKQELSDLYLVKGKLAGEREEYDQAHFWIQKAVEILPENWKALYEEAFLEKRQGHLTMAKEKFEQLLQRNPSYHEAFRELGYIALQQKKIAEGMAHFQQYLAKIPPEKIELRRHLEEMIWNYKQEQYREQVRASIPEEALKNNALVAEINALKEALLKDPPEEAEVYLRLERFIAQSEIQILLETSRKHIGEKQWESALQTLEQLIQKDPEHWEAYLLRGLVWIETAPEQKEAIEDTLQKAIRFQPEHPQGYYVLGTYYFELGEQNHANPEQSSRWFRHAKKWLVLCKKKDRDQFYASQIQGYLEAIEKKSSEDAGKD